MMITFQAVAWEGHDTEDGKFIVRAYGRTDDGRSVAACTYFTPYFFVKAGHRIPDVRGAKLETVLAKDLWGFQNGESRRFFKLTFQTHKALRSAAYVLERDHWAVYEANIDPVLRFMHVTGCTSTGWIQVEHESEDPDTRCDLNIVTSKFTPIKDRDGIAPLKIMSFDIECYSSTGAFPSADNLQDVVFQIGMTTAKFGSSEPLERKCLCVKRTEASDCESFATERDMLERFGEYLATVDPDVITGWNIFGFDLEYLYKRALKNGVEPLWGRRMDEPSQLVVKNLSSSALGNNELKMVPMVGRYVFDLFQDVKREHKLESYSLNFVSKHFLKDQKLDMPVKEIFSRFAEGDPARLGEVAEYCIKDTELPHAIMNKICQIQNVVEMAKACWVPLAFLSERGQQIKVFSQMAYKARQLGFLIPTFRRQNGPGDDKYEGATVLEAQTGAYYGPITALDFASLYPSIMVAHNLCYSTLVMDPRYDNLPGVTYEQFGPHKFAQGVVSLLPTILTDLKAYRKKAKKLMAAAEGTPMEAVYNGQQLAYKISMNSIYGFTGASKGMLPCVAIASTVTMRGRQMIEETKNYVEEHFPGAHVRYGDSVMPDTPVLIKVDGLVHVKPIADLVKEDDWIDYPGFLKDGDAKEQCNLHDVKTWTHLGWQPIKRVIRHKCEKNIWRVASRTGLVDVTEDHSLLDANLGLVKPADVQVGMELFHSFPDVLQLGPPPNGFPKSLDIFSSQESAVAASPRGYFRTFRQDIAQYYHIRLKMLGFNVTFSAQGSAYQVNFTTKSQARTPCRVVKIIPNLQHEAGRSAFRTDVVYDLETEAGTFQAGVGQMIVKNTDSVMVEFDVQGRRGQEAIDYSWAQGALAAEACTKLFKAPNELELEKVYCPYFLYSKKRYAAKMWEGKTSPEGSVTVAFKKIDVKGLQVVRRDSCPYVRETLKKLLEMILESDDPLPVIQYARQASADLVAGNVPIEKLTMSKQLAAEYKVAMPHVAVRDKIRARAPGSEPQQGDRVPFVVVEGPRDAKLVDKAEDPSWVKEHPNVKIDYQYYFTNQLKKPVCDLLEPLVGTRAEQTIFAAATAGSKRGTFDPKMRTIDSYFKKPPAS
jgi:DNA polymerase delta subunit 1